MPRITISYRRDDSGIIVGRIFDRLVARYGRDAVFRDIDNIPPGVDFRHHIDRTLETTDVVLAIVGPNWIGRHRTGARMQSEGDPVRVEIEAALRKNRPLVPVLVMGASMPPVADLPESVQDFAYRNAVLIDAGQDFDVHMDRLVRAVDGILGGPANAKSATGAPAKRGHSKIAWLAAGAGMVAIIVGAAAAWQFGFFHAALSTMPVATNPPPPPPVAPAAPPAAPAPAMHESAPAQPPPQPEAEVAFWQSISSSGNPADFQEYLRQYPDGRFAGLARNRVAALLPPPAPSPQPTAPQPTAPQPAAIAPPPPVSAKCGLSDEQIMQPVKALYQAVNTKNLDLYAAQWAEGGRYVDVARGIQHTKDEKIAERRSRFAAWEAVSLTMDNFVVADRSPGHATVDIVYSITVKNYGRPPGRGQTGVSEQYQLVCSAGRWLIEANIDENR
ncbi:MAG: toll/interleukin-1 receptor domain-containing protein [Alphaproteobacteria bacterium]|nr:toll/interleukin-1 receptor domain-containing protein [Alphaproteobacteria bacterium]